MGVAIMCSYSLVAFWDGTWAFSQRFFTPLFPLVVIGLAGLADAVPRFTLVAASVAVAWSLFLAFNLTIIGGPQYLSNTPGGATDLALVPTARTPLRERISGASTTARTCSISPNFSRVRSGA